MANGMRPCFLSPGQEREFEMLVGYARGGISSCGEEHARFALEGLVPLTHDISAIIRCAKADLEATVHG
ncbi:MAG: hypothetical protein EOR26_05190 [Mesorhizobium sp.]|uniref:hypothetical protein n=1 Tax=Mesorhizobium sp. TaxID=1871066 RepID=UPI000FE30E33|nr:hypothetical protein [Mesorhizobium sp.]RWI51092.1 MAG: hypothetical protein EOR15_06770 [Mesorhizobium sp.]RWJ13929.1 MAG: hypothetical protein EOR24_01225 [Mesorhizobium sp.]RWJ20625.1 MAG: hypothetical protein EOR27_25910 [Mesorhizobium sp.]RWJ32562.1 MAG: hypothetical protein EOR26_05190 [Mesorhizobium sp.]RWJ77317.1 MAG: hypothetical protein EOR35_24855 [Mesorhizobium sp.]